MSDDQTPLSVLGTRWVQSEERWDVVETRRRFFGSRSERVPLPPLRFLDWIVDGVPLRDRLAFSNGRQCTDVTFMSAEARAEADPFTIESLRVLLLESRLVFDPWVQFDDGRAGILFCELCGDLGCGAVSADVRFLDTTVEWRDVAYQDYWREWADGGEIPAFTVTFDREQYEKTVRTLLSQWSTPGASPAPPPVRSQGESPHI